MPNYSIPKPISIETLLKTNWPEEIFIEGGILSRGDCLLIAAESKAGKSTLIAGLIRQMITGGNFLGFRVTKPLRVLYMQAELRESRLKERLIKTYGSLNGAATTSFVWNTRGLIMIEENYDIIVEVLTETKPDVVFIDPMVNFHNFDENNATQMTQFFRKLDRIQHEFNTALVMAQHFKKQQDGNPRNKLPLLEMMRGSSALRGWADTTIAMEGRTADEYRRLDFDIRNSDEPARRLVKYNRETKEFDWHDPIGILATTIAKTMAGGVRMSANQFVDHLIEHGGAIVGRQRTRAFEYKKLLTSTGVVKEEIQGKTHTVFLA